MRALRGLAALFAVAALLLIPAIGASASARPAAVHLESGTTTVTTGPGIAATLIKNGIVPIATAPGTESLTIGNGKPAVTFAFPVTGGKVSLSPLGGTISHRGGILFLDIKTGKQVEVSSFIINLSQGDLTGIVNGNPRARVALFTLGLTRAKLMAGKHSVKATGIALGLTAGAAGALNAALGTSLFSGGLPLGTAATTLQF